MLVSLKYRIHESVKLKIAISFSGDGFGHTSRMVALASQLKPSHELFFWSPERTHSFLKNYFSQTPIFPIPLLQLIKKENQIQLLPTFWANRKTLFFNDKIVKDLAKQLKALEIDAIIADFEPLLVQAGKLANIPTLLFNHQGIVKKYPWLHSMAIFTHIANYFMMPKADDMIISSFYGGDVGPLIRSELSQCQVQKDDCIVVYTKESLSRTILPYLSQFPQENFLVFPSNELDFTDALCRCKAIISSAGHQLISECLTLRKPMLVFPEIGQYEQFLNAHMLEKTGWGQIGNQKNVFKSLDSFLTQLNQFPFCAQENVNFILQDDSQAACEKVLQWLNKAGQNSNLVDLSKMGSPKTLSSHG